jgi:hypothetical protein
VPDKFGDAQWTHLPGSGPPPEFVAHIARLLSLESGENAHLLFDLFGKHQEYISQDNVHPSKEGCVAMRALWADTAVATVYAIK